MNEDGSLSLHNRNNDNLPTALIEADEEINTKEKNIDIFISKLKNFEMGGVFQLPFINNTNKELAELKG